MGPLAAVVPRIPALLIEKPAGPAVAVSISGNLFVFRLFDLAEPMVSISPWNRWWAPLP